MQRILIEKGMKSKRHEEDTIDYGRLDVMRKKRGNDEKKLK